MAAFLRFKAARGARELLRYLVGWREGGESPMWEDAAHAATTQRDFKERGVVR